MDALDRLIPTPRLLERDHIDLAVPAGRAWEVVRTHDLGRSPLIRALFAVRGLPGRLKGAPAEKLSLRLDDIVSTPERPGFRVFIDDPPREVALGAVGKVWQGDIPFVHLPSPEAFAAFAEPDHAKVAWALRVTPLGEHASRVEVEVRVDTTDDESWQKFRRYFRFIGIGSHFIRRVMLRSLARELGAPDYDEDARPLAGDELLPDAQVSDTHGITIDATPAEIWPWLLQMGSRRGGFYAVDLLDNGNRPSARELHPELPVPKVGEVIPATPDGEDGFEVLRVEPERCLILGGLFDPDAQKQLPFSAARPAHHWQVTWAFVLEPLAPRITRLEVRARAAFSPSEKLHLLWVAPVHQLMEGAQLRHLKARAEGTLAADHWRDILEGAAGAAVMAAALLTSFLRARRSHWGLSAEEAARPRPGDELISDPSWSWTHAVEIAAPAAAVWPWVAQLGADRGGFYSYQWLENLIGCRLHNAERIHPEWQLEKGSILRLANTDSPFSALPIVELVPGQYFIAHGAPAERRDDQIWAETTWAFLVEPLGQNRCRFVSRYRCRTSPALSARLMFGPTLVEPIGFAMDRRMLLGVKQRAERAIQPLRQIAAPQLQR